MAQLIPLNPRQYCSTCKTWKLRAEFYERDMHRNMVRCKECTNTKTRAYAKANPMLTKQRKAAWHNAIQPSGLTKNKEMHLRKGYGLSGDDFSVLLKAQGYKCGCCGGPFAANSHKRPMHVDHDHRTGKVRGILCGGCNLILGHAKDSVEVLQRAIFYLQK
jgi:Recombination endonuclease VII